MLPGIPQFFPNANPLNLLAAGQSFTGGVTGTTGSFGYEQRFGFYGYNTLFNVSGNLTKLKGAHNMKTGIFVEHTTRPAQRSSAFNGTLSFNTRRHRIPEHEHRLRQRVCSARFTQYQESNAHPSAHGWFMNTEFYAQDNWRVKTELHRSTRASASTYITPTQSQGDKVAQFEPDQWIGFEGTAPLSANARHGTSRMAKNPLHRRDPSRSCISAVWCRTRATSPTARSSTTTRRRRRRRSRSRRDSGSRGT